jgi:Flp pilus assembly protein TadG
MSWQNPVLLRSLRCRRGTSAVEFAIVFPLLLVVLFGILTFGMYFAVLHSVQQLAAEAARAAIGGLSDTERTTLARANVTANVSFYPFIVPSRLVIVSAAMDATGNIFSVQLRYDAADMIIFNLPAFVPAPSPTIVRAAAIQRGGY